MKDIAQDKDKERRSAIVKDTTKDKDKGRCRMKHKDKVNDKGKRPRLIQTRFTKTHTNDTVTDKGKIAHGDVMW